MVLLRHAQLAALTCLCLGAAAASAAAPQPDPDAQKEAQSLSGTGVSGEILDTAIEHCRRGERQQAMAMFAAIREQLSPPPGLLVLIRELEESGCTPVIDILRTARILAGGGYDSNVSQGITARTLTLGSGDDALELPLDESYRPRASSFAQVAMDYTVPLKAPGWGLLLSGGARANQSASQFDIASASASLSRLWAGEGRAVRMQADWSELWLGGRRYQRTLGATAQTVLKLVDDGAWVAQASATLADYHLQPAQDSAQYELAVIRDRKLKGGSTLFARVALQYDQDRGSRPGGDRNGYQAIAGALIPWQGWKLKPQLQWQHWTSHEDFAAGLIDRKRRNDTVQFALQAEKPLSGRQSLVLEWRARAVHDSIPLYKYSSQSLAAFIQHQF